MKKKLLAGLLASTAVVSLAACDKELAVSKIDLENQDTTATFGQAFADSDLKVTATMSDGTTKDVTNEVTIDTSKVDTSKPGVYAVVVSFGGQSVVYNVTVEAPAQAATVKSIAVAGGNTAFNVGDEFTAGDVVVTATMSDNTTKEVTATIDSSKVDTSKPGVYSVVVSYEGAITTYFVTVSATENVQTLKDLTINATDAKTQYVVGESVSLENLVVYETYSNTIGADTIAQFTDLSGYTVKVTNEDNEEVTGEFTAFGTYTVTISKGELSDGFSIRVGSVVYESATSALEAALSNSNKVNSGTVSIENYGTVNTYEYAYGQNYTTYSNPDGEYHFTLNEDGSVFGVNIYENLDGQMAVSSVYDPTEIYMEGPDFSSVVQYQSEVYGFENLISYLHAAGIEEESEYVWNYKEGLADECTVCGNHHSYTFSYETYVNDYYNFVDVKFTVDPLTNILASANINIDTYYSESMDYNAENNTFTVKAEITEADFTRVIEASQNAGERNLVNEHTPEMYQFESFDLSQNGNPLTNETVIEAVVREPIYVSLSNVTPETASFEVDQVNVVAYDSNNEESYSVFGGYEADYESIVITAYKVGEYTIEVSTSNITKTFKVNVAYSDLTSFEVGVYDSNYYEYVAKSSINVYPNVEVDITSIVNENANPAYTIELAATENASLTEGEDNNYYFVATTEGTYDVVLTSTVNPDLKSTLTITVLPAPTAADILVGTYQFFGAMWGTVTYEFTPESEGATSGTVAISAVGGYADSEGLFNYSYVDGYLECTPANAGSARCYFSAGLNANFELVCIYNGFEQGVCTKVENTGDEEVVENPIIGIHNTTIANLAGMELPYSIEFFEDGTGIYNFQNSWYYGSFSYEVVNNVVAITNVNPMLGTNQISLYGEISGSTLAITIEEIIDETEVMTQIVEFTIAGLSDSEDSEETPSEITVSASYWGVEYVYTANEDGVYTFSVNPNEAAIGYDYSVDTQFTMSLSAGDKVTLVIMTSTNTGQEEMVTLNVTCEAPKADAIDFETAITKEWYFDMASDDNYTLTFTPTNSTSGTITLNNYWRGSLYGTSTYNYTYAANEFTLECTSEDNLLQWYFGGEFASFDSTFTTLIVGAGYNFAIKA